METVEEAINSVEQHLKSIYPSWSNDEIRSEAVRIYYASNGLGVS